MSRVEDALMRLYEDADLRDELTDDEAETLLKWAEAQLTQFDTPALDDEAFTEQVDTLMRLIKQMNRYAGRQGQLSPQGADETPGKIAALAASLGHATAAEQITAAATGEPASTVAALTAILSPVPEEPPADANTETGETDTDDDSTAEAGTTAGTGDSAAVAGGWLYPDADADEYADTDGDSDPTDGYTG